MADKSLIDRIFKFKDEYLAIHQDYERCPTAGLVQRMLQLVLVTVKEIEIEWILARPLDKSEQIIDIFIPLTDVTQEMIQQSSIKREASDDEVEGCSVEPSSAGGRISGSDSDTDSRGSNVSEFGCYDLAANYPTSSDESETETDAYKPPTTRPTSLPRKPRQSSSKRSHRSIEHRLKMQQQREAIEAFMKETEQWKSEVTQLDKDQFTGQVFPSPQQRKDLYQFAHKYTQNSQIPFSAIRKRAQEKYPMKDRTMRLFIYRLLGREQVKKKVKYVRKVNEPRQEEMERHEAFLRESEPWTKEDAGEFLRYKYGRICLKDVQREDLSQFVHKHHPNIPFNAISKRAQDKYPLTDMSMRKLIRKLLGSRREKKETKKRNLILRYPDECRDKFFTETEGWLKEGNPCQGNELCTFTVNQKRDFVEFYHKHTQRGIPSSLIYERIESKYGINRLVASGPVKRGLSGVDQSGRPFYIEPIQPLGHAKNSFEVTCADMIPAILDYCRANQFTFTYSVLKKKFELPFSITAISTFLRRNGIKPLTVTDRRKMKLNLAGKEYTPYVDPLVGKYTEEQRKERKARRLAGDTRDGRLLMLQDAEYKERIAKIKERLSIPEGLKLTCYKRKDAADKKRRGRKPKATTMNYGKTDSTVHHTGRSSSTATTTCSTTHPSMPAASDSHPTHAGGAGGGWQLQFDPNSGNMYNQTNYYY